MSKISFIILIFVSVKIIRLGVQLMICTLSAKDRGATKNPVVNLGTNFDASTFYQDVSSVLSRST